jgi:hypothetical protein
MEWFYQYIYIYLHFSLMFIIDFNKLIHHSTLFPSHSTKHLTCCYFHFEVLIIT